MKRFTSLLIAACLCCAVGCDTEIPTDEMSNIQSSNTTSCNIEITDSQAKEINRIVNSPDSNYIFGSLNMAELYKNIIENKAQNQDVGGDRYCVCGTDVCDKGIGCVAQNNAYSCAGFDNKVVEEGVCSPVLVEQRYLGYLIATRLLPILKELMIVRDISKSVLYRTEDSSSAIYAWSVIRSLIVNDNVNKYSNDNDKKEIKSYFFKSKKYKDRLALFNLESDTTIPPAMKPENYDIVGALAVLGAMAECQNGTSGNCPEEKMYHAVKKVDDVIGKEGCLGGDNGFCQEKITLDKEYVLSYYYHKASDTDVDVWYPFKDLAELDKNYQMIAKSEELNYEQQIKQIVKPDKERKNGVVCNFPTEDDTDNCQICSKYDNDKLVAGPEPCRQIFPENGLVFHINGTNTNTSKTPGVPGRIYSGYREIAARLLKNAGEFDSLFNGVANEYANSSIVDLAKLEGKIENTPEDKIAEKIDQFLVDQTHYLLNAKTNLDKLLTDARIQRLLFLLFDDPAGPSVIEKTECAYVPDLNGDHIKIWDDNENKYIYVQAEKGDYAEVCETLLAPSMISNEDGIVIMNALKNMFSYSYGDYFSDSPKLYEAHRRFFAQYLLSSLSSTEQQHLFEMTFTQNNRCIDHESPTGQVVGINQYCLDTFFQHQIFTFGALASLVFGNGDAETSAENASALADGIIMDSDFELKNSNGDNLFVLQPEQVQKIEERLQLNDVESIAVSSVGIHLGDDTGSNPLSIKVKIKYKNSSEELERPYTLNGMWISHRCPMGASCTENNECGMCSNSDVPHDYGWFRGDETLESEYNEAEGNANIKYNWTHYSNAICEKGILKQLDTSTETP